MRTSLRLHDAVVAEDLEILESALEEDLSFRSGPSWVRRQDVTECLKQFG